MAIIKSLEPEGAEDIDVAMEQRIVTPHGHCGGISSYRQVRVPWKA